MTHSSDLGLANLFRCNMCGLTVIAEDTDYHKCRDVVDYRIEGNILWLSDGEKWYPRKLFGPPKNKHPFKTPDDSTEQQMLTGR